jgi:O-antigen ligase
MGTMVNDVYNSSVKTQYSVLETSSLIVLFALLLTPVVYSTEILMGVMSFKYFYLFFLTCGFVLISLIQLIIDCRDGIGFSFRKIDSIVLCLFLYLVFQIFFMVKPSSIANQQGDKIITFFCSIAIYFALRVFIEKENYRIKMYGISRIAFISIILFESLIVCLQSLSIFPSFSDNPQITVTGTFIHPAMLGGLLAILLPFLYTRANITFTKIGDFASFDFIAIVLGFFTLLLSESRAAFLGTLIAVAYYEFTKGDRFKIAVQYVKRKKWLVTIIVASVLVFVAFIINIRTVSVWGRMLVWKICLPIVADAPIIGHGLGSFVNIYPEYQISYFSNSNNPNEKLLADFVLYTYNEFLQIFIELGAIGTILFIWLIISVLASRYSLKESHLKESGGKVAILSFIIFGFFSYPLSLNYMILYFFFFLSISTLPNRDISKKNSRIFPVSAVGLIMIAPFVFIHPVSSKLTAYRRLQVAENMSPDWIRMGDVYSEQYNLLKTDNYYISRYAEILYNVNNPELGLKVLLKKKGLTYTDYLLIGDMYSDINLSDSAIVCYQKANMLLPNRAQPIQRIIREKSIRERFNQ